MFGFFRKQKKADYIEQVIAYIDRVYTEPSVKDTGGVKYSVRMTDEPKKEDNFEAVSSAMDQYFKTGEAKFLMAELERAKEKTFTEMLMWHIAKSGKKDSAVYNAAQIDRRLFSKIISNPQYKIQKKTVYAFALALELSIDETSEMLLKAGFGLSNSQVFDLIIKFFIEKNIYDIELINAALYHYDQPLLGE